MSKDLKVWLKMKSDQLGNFLCYVLWSSKLKSKLSALVSSMCKKAFSSASVVVSAYIVELR